jgi:hypothetical protein
MPGFYLADHARTIADDANLRGQRPGWAEILLKMIGFGVQQIGTIRISFGMFC